MPSSSLICSASAFIRTPRSKIADSSVVREKEWLLPAARS
jgi:hypothetical protein